MKLHGRVRLRTRANELLYGVVFMFRFDNGSYAMTAEELKELIKTGENGGVEFKRGRGGVPGDFWPSYSAFANTDGGGVKTSTKNFGLPDEELVVLRLTSSRVVEAVRRNPKVTREELVEQHRVTVNGINWQIAKLQKDKVFCRVGGRKFGSWEVLI